MARMPGRTLLGIHGIISDAQFKLLLVERMDTSVRISLFNPVSGEDVILHEETTSLTRKDMRSALICVTNADLVVALSNNTSTRLLTAKLEGQRFN